MKYIKEYHIFNFFKKKKKVEEPATVKSKIEEPVVVKNKVDTKRKLFFDFDENLISSGSEKIIFYKTYIDYSYARDLSPLECVMKNTISIRYLVKSIEEDGSYYYSTWDWQPIDKRHTLSKFNLDELDNELTKLNFVEGASVKILDNNTNGYITKVWTALFARFDLSTDIKENGVISKVLEITNIDDQKFYRLPNQVVSTNDINELSLSEVFEDEIKDYLTDIDESQKFNIVITKKIIDRIGIVNFMVEIKFKDGVENNLDTVSLFFRNINTLKKRINAINGYDFEIEDLHKKGILLKIFNLKKFESMSKGECDICGEDIYTDDRICDDCKMDKDEIEFDDTTIHLEEPPQTLPAYPMSQNVYFEGKEEIFKNISYDNFEDWAEGRNIEEFNDFEDNYIRSMFNNLPAPFEYELDMGHVDNLIDSEDKRVMNIVIYEKDSTDGIGIRIEKYNDEYFHVLIEDICKDGDEWDSLPFSDGGHDAICDQVQGVVDYIKHELRDSCFRSSADWRREHLSKNESIHNKYTKNDYYEFTDKLPSFMSSGQVIHEDFTKEEIDEISNRYKLPKEIVLSVGGIKKLSFKSIDWDYYTGLTISIRKYRLHIYKHKDEWYRVVVKPNYGTMNHLATRHYDYVCDQFVGLLKLLDEFIKNKINYETY